MTLPTLISLLLYTALARAGPVTTRQDDTSSPGPIVDLGYAVHQATVNVRVHVHLQLSPEAALLCFAPTIGSFVLHKLTFPGNGTIL